ncbi:hypothetical protein MKZ38_007662 [Zalerion maritima]|uniref:Chromosome segregation ATPase family protein n=1 Tax=Zalerion maritima TaxID=339359 RepID=A0AAD5RYL1_9PEZI|nr:hypothetical protein MKZ38_007662 [Zalerion maritima]
MTNIYTTLIPLRKTTRWDSSDPERAPPPLPLNPQSPLTSRAGTSSAIASAHAALNEKAREAALPPPITKRGTDSNGSPVRNNAHKRMQSLQPNSVRDIGFLLEGGGLSGTSTPRAQSPEKGRPSTPIREREGRSLDRDSSKTPSSNAPNPNQSLTPIVRPAARRHQTSILGENTPPQSDTMRALQSMATPTRKEKKKDPRDYEDRGREREREAAPLSNVTSQANNTALVRTPQSQQPPSVDALSGQILSLTNIAQSLQKEMTNLSRRSRDNATDLMSLKEATNVRDEDIRKSLRDIVHNIHEPSRPSTRDPYSGPLSIDNKPFAPPSPSKTGKNGFSLPRIPSPSTFAVAMDRESMLSTPSLVNDGPTGSILLERVLHEMGTKEGQDELLKRLDRISKMVNGMASGAKIDELIKFIKQYSEEQSLMAAAGGSGGNGGGSGNYRHRQMSPEEENPRGRELHLHSLSLAQNERTSSAPPTRASDLLNDDILKIIRTVKDSVHQGGGLTAEVKALVRELRGEVLGMGRELGRRLDEVSSKSMDKEEAASKDEIEDVIEEGLGQLKKHMNELLREHRRQSAAAAAAKGPLIDYQEIYKAMRTAIEEGKEAPDLCRDDVIDAVKDAWENYKPEITVEQIGLERDEVLACLQEGMVQYMPRDEHPPGATREEVFAAVVEGLKHFTPPKIETPATISRDEVLDAVRECLEDFEFPVAPEITKGDVLDAVKEGLNWFDFPSAANALVPHGSTHAEDEVSERLQEILHVMRTEFRAVSEEAKQNVAANGRDTEQVLDATKDGFAQLRTDMEVYVDRAAGASNQEDFMENLVNTLDSFREEVGDLVEQANTGSKEMLKEELESLRDAVNSSLVPHTPQINPKEIIGAVHEGLGTLREALEHVRTEVIRPKPAPTELLDAIQEGFNDLRASIDKIGDKPPDLSANDEILDALKEGLDNVRSEIDIVREQTQNQNDKAVTPFTGGAEEEQPDNSTALIPPELVKDFVKSDDIRNLEGIIHELGAKIEAMDNGNAPPPPAEGVSQEQMDRLEHLLRQPGEESVRKEDIDRLEELFKLPNESSVGREDIERLEELLKQPREEAIQKDDLARLENIIRSVQESVAEVASAAAKSAAEAAASCAAEAAVRSRAAARGGDEDINLDGAATREDIIAIETILRNTKARIDDLIDGDQGVRKDHIDTLECLLLETRENMGTLKKGDLEPLEALVFATKEGMSTVKKDDLDSLEAIILETKEQLASVTGQINDLSRREDVSMLEAVVGQVHAAFEEMKEREETQLADPERVTKTMVGDLEVQCLDIKSVLDSMAKTDLATLSTKEDIKPLEDMVKDLGEKMAGHAEAHAKSFEERQAEIVGVSESITEVKQLLGEFQTMVKEKIEAGATGVDGLGKVIDELSTTINDNGTVGADLREMFDAMKAEFEDSRSSFIGAKLETDEKFQETVETLKTCIDEKVNDILVKYEEFQIQMDERTKAGAERDGQVEASISSSKAVADELKDLVDALGTTVADSLEKVEEASKTVFVRVEDLVKKSDDLHEENKTEHGQTREEIQEAVKVVEALQGAVGEFQPQLLQTVKDVLLLVGDHFDHSKSSVDEVKRHIEENKPEPPPPFPVDEVKYDDTVINQKLDQLASHDAAVDETSTTRDAQVNEKLDNIVSYQATSDAAYSRLDTLDKVHSQVISTAAEITMFLESQKQRIADEHDDREKTLQDTNLAIERRTAEKEVLDTSVSELRDTVSKLKVEEEQMQDSMAAAQALKNNEDLLRAEMLAQLKDEVAQLKTEEVQMRESIKASAVLREEEDKLRMEMLIRIRDEVSQLKTEEEQLRTSLKKSAALKEEEDAVRSLMLASLREEEERLRESLTKTAALKDEEDMLRFKMLASLKDEEEKLQSNIFQLRKQNDDLIKRKTKLTTDVGSLETALHIRREDLVAIEQRAQGLERRILDGVMDQSRIVMMAKNALSAVKEKKEGSKSMSRKRVSNANNLKRLDEEDMADKDAPPSIPTTPASSVRKRQPGPRAAINIAVNRSLAAPNGSPAGGRRILSLNQISQNVPSGGLGRSQSVRTSTKGRKSSWAGRTSTISEARRESTRSSMRDSLPAAPSSTASRNVSLIIKAPILEEGNKENAAPEETPTGEQTCDAPTVEAPRNMLAIEAAPAAEEHLEVASEADHVGEHHDEESHVEEHMDDLVGDHAEDNHDESHHGEDEQSLVEAQIECDIAAEQERSLHEDDPEREHADVGVDELDEGATQIIHERPLSEDEEEFSGSGEDSYEESGSEEEGDEEETGTLRRYSVGTGSISGSGDEYTSDTEEEGFEEESGSEEGDEYESEEEGESHISGTSHAVTESQVTDSHVSQSEVGESELGDEVSSSGEEDEGESMLSVKGNEVAIIA